MPEVSCPGCSRPIVVDDSQLGAMTSCPNCGQIVFVEQAGQQSEQASSDAIPAAQPPEPSAPPASSPAADFIAPSTPATTPDQAADASQPPVDLVAEVQTEAGAALAVAPAAAAALETNWTNAAASGPDQPAGSGESASAATGDATGPAEAAAFDTASAASQSEAPAAGATQADFSDMFAGSMASGSATPDSQHASDRVPATAPAKSAPAWLTYAIVYICGAAFGLVIGRFMFSNPAPAPAGGLETIRDYGVNKDKTKFIKPTTAIPAKQLKKLGDTVRLERLAVTALAVERRRISLVRANPISQEREVSSSEGECLVLRVRLQNTSKNVEFAPLDEMFLRPHDPKQFPNYSFIEPLDGGDPISMYELSAFSELNIEGQPFDSLEPGGEMEAIVAAAEGSAERASGRMVWRLQVRTVAKNGQSYSTVVGFRFHADQIEPG